MSFGLSRGKTLDPGSFGIEKEQLPAFDAGRFDPRTFFEHADRPFELEIGSGKGTFLVQVAAVATDRNFLGIEWAGEFYRYAADRIRRRQLDNVRVLHADATEFIRYWCPDAIVDVLHLYFSDPWPKKRHHKRRVIQDASLVEFHRVLVQGGELRIVTDHADLWAWNEEHVARHGDLFERRPYEPLNAEDGELVGTNYERKFIAEGRAFNGMTLVKR
ncbi:MAG: tRNA (guanosine(46)-N7)-methyltransferase TrmB [Planctomycetota bacterium]